jgi:putative membrane protein
MFWGFHGLWLLMPLFLLGKFFWLIILGLLIWALIRRFSSRNRPMAFFRQEPFYNPGMHPGMPPTQHSAMETLRQRYARGEIDATTFDQMRERLESSSGPSQQ